MSHTPGKWIKTRTQYRNTERLEIMREGYSEPIAHVYSSGVCNGYHYTMPADDNANIIIAALDLLDVVEKVEYVPDGKGNLICPWCEYGEPFPHGPDCERQLALAKAKGL